MSAGIAVFISGNGSNLQAIMAAVAEHALPFSVSVVVSHRADAFGLVRAQRAGIPTVVVDHLAYESREAFELALVDALAPFVVELVVLAGFMRKLTRCFLDNVGCDVINIHPSLLPQYPGLNTHQRVLDAAETSHGCTVHYVTEALDAGPIVAQAALSVVVGETAAALQSRVHELEHMLYWRAIECIVKKEVQWGQDGVYFRGKLLPKTGLGLLSPG